MSNNVISLSNFTKATFDKNRLILQDSVTLDEWKDLGQNLKQVEGSVQFWIGDWARFGEEKGYIKNGVKSELYTELEELTGFSRGTIKNFKTVSESVDPSLRDDRLSYSHHRTVAHLPTEKQKELLNRSVEESLSVSQLRGIMYSPAPRDDKHEAMLSAQRIGEKLEMEKEVEKLLARINSMPKLYRMKIKQGIK